MTNQFRPATPGQLSAVGFKITGTIIRVLGQTENGLSFEKANHLILNDEKALEKLTEKFCEEILGIKADPWIEEKKRIEIFYKKFFNRVIDWSNVTPPAKDGKMNRLEYIFSDITEDQYFEAYAQKFGKDKVWKEYNSITKAIDIQQEHPKGDYVLCHVGGDEPDMLGLSYNDGIEKGIKFMIPKEGIVSAFRHRSETGKMYDTKGITRFATLDSGGYAMYMYRDYDGKFYMGNDNRDYRNSDSGLRQVSF